MRQCEVYVHGHPAGILMETGSPKEYVFSYFQDYLKENREAVSLSMPLSKNEYRSKELFPYFSNLLSEGENREIQFSFLHIDKDDDFGFLLATAEYDTVGAVTVKVIPACD